MDKKPLPPASIADVLGTNSPRKVEPLYAVMHYGHKTGGTPILVSKSQKEMIERKTRRHTYGSYLGRTMG